MNPKLGYWHFWVTMIGFNLTFFPMHFSGLYGQPRRTWIYTADTNIEFFNQLSTVGAFIFGLGSLIVVYNIFWSRKNGEEAGHNPWDAPHLEWAIPSPPHHYNFPVLPEVRSREPLWHEDEKKELEAALLVHASPEPEMPNPSYWPLLTAAGISLTWCLVLTGIWWVPLIGLLSTFFCMYKWATEPQFG